MSQSKTSQSARFGIKTMRLELGDGWDGDLGKRIWSARCATGIHPHAHNYTCPSLLCQGEDDGDKLIKVAKWLEARDSEKPLGVYALYDKAKQPQYVGYSRNMVLAVKVSAYGVIVCTQKALQSGYGKVDSRDT